METEIIVWYSLLFFVIFYLTTKIQQEGFNVIEKTSCPTKLVKHQGKLYMTVDGKTTEFKNLEEYTNFVKAMRTRGVRCPVLYAETIHDSQGSLSLRSMDDPITPTTGLGQSSADRVVKDEHGLSSIPPNRSNSTNFPLAYDPDTQDQGGDLPIDKMFHDSNTVSVNPMDANWGGRKFTRQEINESRR